MDFGIVNTALQTVAKLVNAFKEVTAFSEDSSLTQATKLTRVEPLTIISKDLLNLEYMPDVSQALLSIFAGYYLQAISMLTKVQDVEVLRILDKLNPDRDGSAFLMQDQVSVEAFSLESALHALPTPNRKNVLAIEADNNDSNSKTIMEAANLSVGKLLNVNICYNKNNDTAPGQGKASAPDTNVSAVSVTIPVSIRLLASVIPTHTITRLLTFKSEDNSLSERWHAWRAGRISFIGDLILCQDLIDEQKRVQIKDETGTMDEILRRVHNAKKYGLLTKNPSLVAASNIFVISEEVAHDLESKLGGKLSNVRIRQKAFENTYAMIIAVVDREWERVTFYSRGIAQGTDLSIKEIKTAAKGKGPDIGDILKAYNMGLPPQF